MQTQTQSQPQVGNLPAKVVNMPGGGAGKTSSPAKAKESKPATPVNPLYTKASPDEKGAVDATKVAALKAKANRPAPLSRKSKIKLDKTAKKALKTSRKEAAEKYKLRSEETKKDLVYRKKALAREIKHDKNLKKKNMRAPKKLNTNCTMIYSVGTQPKYKTITQRFREFRKFNSAQLKLSKNKEISIIYKVGQPTGQPAKAE